jgi:hypothetical protein
MQYSVKRLVIAYRTSFRVQCAQMSMPPAMDQRMRQRMSTGLSAITVAPRTQSAGSTMPAAGRVTMPTLERDESRLLNPPDDGEMTGKAPIPAELLVRKFPRPVRIDK